MDFRVGLFGNPFSPSRLFFPFLSPTAGSVTGPSPIKLIRRMSCKDHLNRTRLKGFGGGVSKTITEVQRLSFVGYTGSESGSPHLWNLQNLHAVLVPP